ncbi:hypothetical protein [Pantoea agglomerans]|uniref:hypothetical protein n=1 Tax=Enterobacter agglomerans TaxID=549 RepID=UPI002B1D7ED7|nr:hypothetical protein [Pantoea agglomerans]
MLEEYFYDKHGLEQRDSVKRQKAVSAVLQIIHASCAGSAVHNTLSNIKNVSDAADQIQAALDKGNNNE